MPGAREALARLAPTHELAIATNTARVEVDLIVAQLGLGGFLRTTITREDYVRAKPAPDAYLAAAASLCLRPRELAIVDDKERRSAAPLDPWIPVTAPPNALTLATTVPRCGRRRGSLHQL